MEEQMPRIAPAVFSAVLLAAGAADAAPPIVHIPPGSEQPVFGGEILLTEAGPVVGFWTTQCRTWRIRSRARRGGPRATPPVDMAVRQFVSGLISRMPNYDALSPTMAEAVRRNLNTYWPSFNRMGSASNVQQFDTDEAGNMLFVVNQRGGKTHWNVTVDPNGKIAGAFICQGEGL
jgi:hypothetical protein